MKKIAKRLGVAVAALFVAIQFIPYGRDHTNPKVTKEPRWASTRTRALAKRACFDCHSNETRWPWYSYVAPASWLVQRDVVNGRENLNFSEWELPPEGAENSAEQVETGEMPLPSYLLMQPQARLTEAEKKELIEGFKKMFGGG